MTEERPWTKGKWRRDLAPYDNYIVDGNSHVLASTSGMGEFRGNTHDTDLIVLAPEMAEIILSLTDARLNPLPYPLDEYAPKWMHELYDMGDKLRSIGVEQPEFDLE